MNSKQESFEELVRNKAKHMVNAPSFRQQFTNLGFKSDDELKGFKLGRWDAMIFDMAIALSLPAYATRDFRKRLIEKWQSQGLC